MLVFTTYGENCDKNRALLSTILILCPYSLNSMETATKPRISDIDGGEDATHKNTSSVNKLDLSDNNITLYGDERWFIMWRVERPRTNFNFKFGG